MAKEPTLSPMERARASSWRKGEARTFPAASLKPPPPPPPPPKPKGK